MSKFKEFLQNEKAAMPTAKLGTMPSTGSALLTQPLGWNIPSLHQYQKRSPASGFTSFTALAQSDVMSKDRNFKMFNRLGDFARAVLGTWEEKPYPGQSEYGVIHVDKQTKMVYGILKQWNKSHLIEKPRSFVAIGSHFTSIEWPYLKKIGVFIDPSETHNWEGVEQYSVIPRVDMNVELLIAELDRLGAGTNWKLFGAQVIDTILQGMAGGKHELSRGIRTDV